MGLFKYSKKGAVKRAIKQKYSPVTKGKRKLTTARKRAIKGLFRI
jgi:hypothetical protein